MTTDPYITIPNPQLEDYQAGREVELQGVWRLIEGKPPCARVQHSDSAELVLFAGVALHALGCPVRYLRPEPEAEVLYEWESPTHKCRMTSDGFQFLVGEPEEDGYWVNGSDSRGLNQIVAIKQLLAERDDLTRGLSLLHRLAADDQSEIRQLQSTVETVLNDRDAWAKRALEAEAHHNHLQAEAVRKEKLFNMTLDSLMGAASEIESLRAKVAELEKGQEFPVGCRVRHKAAPKMEGTVLDWRPFVDWVGDVADCRPASSLTRIDAPTEIGLEHHTSEEWMKRRPGLVILDPDGWDRSNYQFSFYEEMICENEFNHRVMRSTHGTPDTHPVSSGVRS